MAANSSGGDDVLPFSVVVPGSGTFLFSLLLPLLSSLVSLGLLLLQGAGLAAFLDDTVEDLLEDRAAATNVLVASGNPELEVTMVAEAGEP